MKKEEGEMGIWGWWSTKLVWNETKWSFLDRLTRKEIAYTNTTDDYPIGLHKWYFVDGECQDSEEDWREMLLHSCETGKFVCRNGKCVDFKRRCDRSYDCSDFSDEKNCSFILPEVYDKSQSPQPSVSENGLVKLADINIGIKILDIIGINEEESKLELKFNLEATWSDDRLAFISLNEDERKNIIDNFTYIWIPQIGFIDVVNPIQFHLGETDEIITTSKTKNGNFTVSDDVDQNLIYHGKNFRITKKATFVGSFLCSFYDIYKYPFDTETCSIKMVMSGKNYYSTKLVASNLQYNGEH